MLFFRQEIWIPCLLLVAFGELLLGVAVDAFSSFEEVLQEIIVVLCVAVVGVVALVKESISLREEAQVHRFTLFL